MRNRFTTLLFSLAFLPMSLCAQSQASKEDIEAYKREAEKLVSFVEYIFNAVGSEDHSVQDKDIVINESYLKAFRDSKVQIEDDLVENREVITNKDVQAYLKDIDFFFKGASFELRVDEVREGVSPDGNLFFTLKLNRRLKGKSISGDSVNNSLVRYMEVNIDERNKDLRVVSIYTTKIAEKEELVNWWNTLSEEWKKILGSDIVAFDNFPLSDVKIVDASSYDIRGMVVTDKDFDIAVPLKKAINIERLNISENQNIMDLSPLSELSELKELDMSKTMVSSLFPLRNLNSLEKLNCSYSPVQSLDPLVYSIRLREIDISYTQIADLGPIANLPALQTLKANQTIVSSFEPLKDMGSLVVLSLESNNRLQSLDVLKGLDKVEMLNIQDNRIANLEALKGLKSLKTLDISHTDVKSLAPLSELQSLESVSLLNTQVASLEPLIGTNVRQVFCEGSAVSRQEVIKFLAQKPEVEVIFQTKDLGEWWTSVPDVWKKLVFNDVPSGATPTAETLHKIIKIEEVDISGHTEIDNIKPLEKLLLLRRLDVSGTSVADLSPIDGLSSLEELNFSNTQVTDLAPLQSLKNLRTVNGSLTRVSNIDVFDGFAKLEELNFDNTEVKYLGVINSLPSFRVGYFDNSKVEDGDVAVLTHDDEKSVVVYETDQLRNWWGLLTDEWQDVFRKAANLDKRPSREEIHRLTGARSFVVRSILIKDITPMSEFVRLRDLKFNDTQVSDLSPLASMQQLEVLDCSRNPIGSLAPLANLRQLRVLYADNTQISDIDALAGLVHLEELKISGTDVKDLRPLESLTELKVLEFYNTRVKKIKPIMELSNLKSLKCYNNSINSKHIDEFKANHPQCEVVFY